MPPTRLDERSARSLLYPFASHMAHSVDDSTRDLLERFDARLREAKEVRNSIRETWRQRLFYPERREPGRKPDQPSALIGDD